jgi:hypothetical protein
MQQEKAGPSKIIAGVLSFVEAEEAVCSRNMDSSDADFVGAAAFLMALGNKSG